MIRALGAVLLVAVAGALSGASDARRCRFPAQGLRSPRDTAAWCAREFIVRNGYTELPPSREMDEIALEPTMDIGRSLDDILGFRRNTVALEPAMSCFTKTGFMVSFMMPNQINQPFGRGVVMTREYLGLTLLRPWVRNAGEPAPDCMAPQLPAIP